MNKRKKINDFITYCCVKQNNLKKMLSDELNAYYKKVKNKSGFLYAKGNIPVMLVAHLDTVHQQQCTPNNIFINCTNDIITSTVGIGGDDRCGVYMIMEILKTTNLRPYILFVEDEEIGSLGAKEFVKRYNKTNLSLNFIIELDRRGSEDSVYYDLDNIDFEDYINKFGFTTALGSFTDICVLCPNLDCAGVNLSCGYYKEHQNEHYVVFSEMYNNIQKVISILSYVKDDDYFEWKEDYNKYYYNYTNYTSQNLDYACGYCGAFRTGDFDEDGIYICEHCADNYQLKRCVICGTYTHNKNCICEYCKEDYGIKDDFIDYYGETKEK